MKVDWSLETLSVDAVTESWANRSIRPNPEYQRGLQWKRRQQQLLIDSIFRGYPLPRFYFERKASKDPLGTAVVSLDVIDGQQRIIALTQFRNDEWPLLESEKLPLPPAVRRLPCPWGGTTFSGLDRDLRDRFLALTLPVVLIEDAETDEVRDLFIRLQAGTPLTTQQVRDAWPGNVSPYVEVLAGKLNRQGRYQRLFSAIDRRGGGARDEDLVDTSMDARQACAQLLCLFMAVESGQPYPSLGTRSLDDLYHRNTEFDPAGERARRFEELLGGCQAVIVDRRPTGMSRRAVRKNQLFSLFIFLRDVLVGPADFGRAVPKIAGRFWAEDDTDAYEPKGGRVISPTTIAEHASWFRRMKMNGLVLPELDAQRLFSHNQRSEIWERYGGKCGICGQGLISGEEEYDHVIPWISGGRTEPGNGRPVHRACHSRGAVAAA